MSLRKRKLYIFYRHTNNFSGIGKNRPEWFSYSKSFNNIIRTVDKREDTVFTLMYDGEGLEGYEGNIVTFKGGSDKNSFVFTYNYISNLELDNNDLIYLCENDYLHVEEWVDILFNLYETYDIPGYVSLYDHYDKYVLPQYDDLVSKIYISDTRHWRTVPSTCGSFVCTYKVFKEDLDIHSTFYSDHDKFVRLQQERGRVVLSPMPSLSTHCESEWLAPIINWKNVNSNS